MLLHEIAHEEAIAEALHAAYRREPSRGNQQSLQDAVKRLVSLYERLETGAAHFHESGEWWITLGVSRTASIDAIKAAYRRLAKRYHPDSVGTGGELAFAHISEAYAAALQSRPRT